MAITIGTDGTVRITIDGYDWEPEEEEAQELKIVSGDFAEGSTVTVSICGKEFTRKVKYSKKKWADLYITVNGYDITYSEFYDREAFADADYTHIIERGGKR